MKTESTDVAINLEYSFNGKDFYNLRDIKIVNSNLVEKATKLIREQLSTIESRKEKPESNSDEVYLRVKKETSLELTNYLNKQKLNYNSLTSQEKKILVFIWRGYRQKAIAYILCITINTYKYHFKNLYRKMGFKNKVQMALWCDKYLDKFFKIVHN